MIQPTPQSPRRPAAWHRYAAALVLVDAYYWLWEWFHFVWPFNQPKLTSMQWHLQCAMYTNLTLALVAIGTWLVPIPRRFDSTGRSLRRGLIAVALLVFVLFFVQSWYLHRKSAWLFIEDIGSTTVKADRMLFAGVEPVRGTFRSILRTASARTSV